VTLKLPRPNPRKRLAALVAAGAVALGCWVGCSEQRDYRTLSVFFDGVPDPNAKAKSDASSTTGPTKRDAGGKTVRVIASTHKPFADEKCTACHAQPTQVFASALDSNLCMKCHEKVLDAYPAMHGPVIGKACLWCHEPHESSSPSLLRTTAISLCIECHDRATLSTRVDAHKADAGSCLDCHSGHGGAKAPFLRAAALMPNIPAKTDTDSPRQ
jgi:predicted CXXCH cytochrome family protein